MSEDNSILKYFRNANSGSLDRSTDALKLRANQSGEVAGGEEASSPSLKRNLNINNKEISGADYTVQYKTKPNVNSGVKDIDKELLTRGDAFSKAAKNAASNSYSLVSDVLNDGEKSVTSTKKSSGHQFTLTRGDSGKWYSDPVDDLAESVLGSHDDTFISNQVRYDRKGSIKSIGNLAIDRLKNKASGNFSNALNSSISSALGKVGIMGSSDYPFKGRAEMFGNLALDPGANNKFAVVIEEPDDEECAADEYELVLNSNNIVSGSAHNVSGGGILKSFVSSFVNGMTGSSYPTCSPYKDLYSSGWVPCLGFGLDYGRLISESLGVSKEYNFEVPSYVTLSPILTTEILEDNSQSVRRWLKDYMDFMNPVPGVTRPMKTCCCKVTVLTYNKQWSRDAGDASDSVLNLFGLGNSQNKTSNFLKFVFYAYPTANVTYQTTQNTNIDSVSIQWNVVGEKVETVNALGNLINKFI